MLWPWQRKALITERFIEAIGCLTHEVRRAADHMAQHNDNNAILHRLAEMEKRIMATQTDIITKLNDALTTLNRIGDETDKSLLLIKGLQDAVNNQQNASPELVAATDALVAQLQVVDDKVPDAVVVPPPAA